MDERSPEHAIIALTIVHLELRVKALVEYISTKLDGFDEAQFELFAKEFREKHNDELVNKVMAMSKINP